MNYEQLIDALRDHGSHVNANGSRAKAQCPAHDDNRPSLSITRTEGRTLVYCQAGCRTVDVMAALNRTMADLYDEPYHDRRYGDVYAKYEYPGGRVVLRTADKQFPQPGNNNDRSLYHADRIGDAKTVYVVEGEEDVHAVEAHGGAAVCPAMGAGKAKRFDWTPLAGKCVIIVADKDTPGRDHATQIVELLNGTAATVRIVEAAFGKDASDHLAAGKTLDELIEAPTILEHLGMFDGEWLDAQVFPELEYAVDRIIPEGYGLLVAPPKTGKSWLVNNIGLGVAAGGWVLGHIKVKKRPVLYLALEDGKRRLQSRSRRQLAGQPLPAGLKMITNAKPHEALQAIDEFLARHTSEKPLIILDTLGKVKPPRRPGDDPYLLDYAIGGRLKDAVDTVPGATLLVVHHTRKMVSPDFVDSVSGTQGIAGSADFVLVLARKRHSDDAVLSVTGRDIPEAEYALHADEKVLWRLDGDDLTAAAQTVKTRRAQSTLGERQFELLTFVNSRPESTAADVAAKLTITPKQAGDALRELYNSGRITRVRRGVYGPNTPETPETPENAGQNVIPFADPKTERPESDD